MHTYIHTCIFVIIVIIICILFFEVDGISYSRQFVRRENGSSTRGFQHLST